METTVQIPGLRHFKLKNWQYRVAFPSGCILDERNEVLRVEESTDSSIVIIFSVTTKDLTPLEVEQQRRMSQQSTSGSEVDMNESEVILIYFYQ